MSNLELFLGRGKVEISTPPDGAEVVTLQFAEGNATWDYDQDHFELTVWLANGRTLQVLGEAKLPRGVEVVKR